MSTGNRKDIITTKLENAFKEAGSKLTDQEVRTNDNLPDPAEYAFHYGSYQAAANYVWRRLHPADEGNIRLTPLAMAMLKKKEEQKKS